MKVVRIEADDYLREENTRVVYNNIKNREEGINRIVQFAQEEQRKIPNNPHIDQSGVDEVSVWVGVYRVVTFRLTD